jgi:hypothetical protein
VWLARHGSLQVCLEELATPTIAELEGQIHSMALILRRHEAIIGEEKENISTSLHVAEKSARLRPLESDLSFPSECVDQRPWDIRSRGLCVYQGRGNC